MNLYVGTSGFSYAPWRGKFYPREIKPAEMLSYYAEHFKAVEINNTFYRMPSEELLEGWTKLVPADFKFALKAPQKITHFQRLKDSADDVANFLRVAKVLKTRLGPLLFQLPGNFKKDAGRLREFLKLLPRKQRVAFEFRNETWFDAEVFELLRERNGALCIAESEDTVAVPFEATADWGYLRLRRLDYGGPDLKKWNGDIKKQNWSDAYVFFKHEDEAKGPAFASALLKLVETE